MLGISLDLFVIHMGFQSVFNFSLSDIYNTGRIYFDPNNIYSLLCCYRREVHRI